MSYNADLPIHVIRARLESKIVHLTKKMRTMNNPASRALLAAAKGELSLTKKRLAALGSRPVRPGGNE